MSWLGLRLLPGEVVRPEPEQPRAPALWLLIPASRRDTVAHALRELSFPRTTLRQVRSHPDSPRKVKKIVPQFNRVVVLLFWFPVSSFPRHLGFESSLDDV
jgi:hypothetical protein